jgi:hypothetical protein
VKAIKDRALKMLKASKEYVEASQTQCRNTKNDVMVKECQEKLDMTNYLIDLVEKEA